MSINSGKPAFSKSASKVATLSGSTQPKPLLFLDQLGVDVTGTIVVMIGRVWDVNVVTGRYLSTDFVEGNMIHCSAKSSVAHNFLRMKEGGIYSVKNFMVLPNKDEFRIFRHDRFMIEFDGETSARKVSADPHGFRMYPFRLIEFDQVEPAHNKYLIDIAGYVTNIGRTSYTKSGSKTLMFYLENHRGQSLRVTLWGELGDVLVEKKTTHAGVCAMVLTGMSGKEYNNKLYLSSTSSMVFYDDDDIPCLQELRADDRMGGTTRPVAMKSAGKVLRERMGNGCVRHVTGLLTILFLGTDLKPWLLTTRRIPLFIMFIDTCMMLKCSAESIMEWKMAGLMQHELEDSIVDDCLMDACQSPLENPVPLCSSPALHRDVPIFTSQPPPAEFKVFQNVVFSLSSLYNCYIIDHGSILINSKSELHNPYAIMNTASCNNLRMTPSFTDLLQNSVRIHANTIIKQDGRVQSYCGLRITETTTDYSGVNPYPLPDSTRLRATDIAGPSTSKYASTRLPRRSAGPTHLRKAKKGAKKATFTFAGSLFQQYLVDAYTAVEEQRLKWTRNNQDTLRFDLYHNLCDAVTRGDTSAVGLGKRIVLPRTFTGSPRYMMNNYQDAMALCRAYDNPDLFITFTSNPKWPEISEMLAYFPGQKPHDRPEIGTHVFKIKLTKILHDLTQKHVFGKSRAEEQSKCKTPGEVDDIISAEMPSPTANPDGYKVVTDYMLHGSCGKDARNAACTSDGKCSKHFPKPFLAETFLDEDGYPHYCRRDNKVTFKKGNFIYDNKHVVPHNRYLLLKYKAHINLSFHLPYQNAITLRDSERLPALLQREGIDVTMFTDWFELNKRDPDARTLTYADIPKHYVWHEQSKLGVFGFEDLMTVNKRVCATFKEACFGYGLLHDDKEWSHAIAEASLWALGPQQRDIFVTMLIFCDVSRPLKL
ncbi:DNA helicase PIF1, ATP-dependent [Tanacetum coccineum]